MKTGEDVRVFFQELVDKYSLNFHPDTPFEDFDVLTKAQAKALNARMDKAFNICEREKVDIYNIGLKVHKATLARVRRAAKKQMTNHVATLRHNSC